MEKSTTLPSYLIEIKKKLLEDSKDTEGLVLCHGDVHANNVIWTKDKIFLIDWTCGGLDYPIVDLAVASMFWNFNSVQDDHLLKNYLCKMPDETIVQKLAIFKSYAKISWAMWPIMKILEDFPEKIKDLGSVLETRFKTSTYRSFEEYRIALFQGTFNTLVREFDDWVDLHLARIQSAKLEDRINP